MLLRYLNLARSEESTMSLTDHIEALRWHLVRSILAIILFSAIIFFNIEWIFSHIILRPASPDFIAYKWLAAVGDFFQTNALNINSFHLNFQNTQLSGQFMMSFTVSFILGFIMAFPYVTWEFWRFIKPAMYEKEVKHTKGLIVWVSILFLFGVAFAYFIVAPFTISFFANYQLSPSFKNIITIDNYYKMMSDLIIGMGLVFELPIVVYFLSRIGVLTPAVLKKNNKFAIVAILILSAIITPPDWLSMLLVAIPLLALYQISLWISFKVIKKGNL